MWLDKLITTLVNALVFFRQILSRKEIAGYKLMKGAPVYLSIFLANTFPPIIHFYFFIALYKKRAYLIMDTQWDLVNIEENYRGVTFDKLHKSNSYNNSQCSLDMLIECIIVTLILLALA